MVTLEPAPDVEERLHLRLGVCLVAKNDQAGAFAQFAAVAADAKSPLAPEARFRAGECQVQLKAYPKAIELFGRLLLQVGAQPRWAIIMADWLDAGTIPDPEGAEDGTYLAQNPPYRAANGLVATTTEMMALPGMTREEFERIRPYVAALPPGTRRLQCSRRSTRLACSPARQNRSCQREP